MQHEHAPIVDALGAPVIAAEIFGPRQGKDDRRAEAIYAWKKNGIPWRWRPTVERLAREHGVPLPPDFLGHETPPASEGRAA